jgi:hypothetical protein
MIRSQSQAEIIPEHALKPKIASGQPKTMHYNVRRNEQDRIERENEKIAKKIIQM